MLTSEKSARPGRDSAVKAAEAPGTAWTALALERSRWSMRGWWPRPALRWRPRGLGPLIPLVHVHAELYRNCGLPPLGSTASAVLADATTAMTLAGPPGPASVMAVSW
jgi:hypothetical protein